MAKICRSILVLAIIFTCFAGVVSANTASSKTISVTINGEKQNYTVSPIMVNGSVLVPLRAIFESLGAELKYDAETRVITSKKGDTQVILKVGSNVAAVNGNELKLNQPPLIDKGTTYVPVRFVSEALGAEVNWDPQTWTVVIRNVDIYMLDDAIREDNLDKFTELLMSGNDKSLANQALFYTLEHQKGAQWAAAALRAGADVFHPKNVFEIAINYKRADVVKLLLDEGRVGPSAEPPGSNWAAGYSYIGLAYRKGTSYTYDARRKRIASFDTEPSLEIADMLHAKGFRAETLDAYWPLAERNTEWFDWMLAHGVDPDGEIPKLVSLDETEQNIAFDHISSMTDPNARMKLINAAYAIASWNPSPECMQNFATLVVKYGASLDPLTQAQKDRMLHLAKWREMDDLAEALRAAGAKDNS